MCFIHSLAAYSVASYILSIKDRHNGNIMIDDEGHIIHIDFGFILDISPGGINFENSPFKLTSEMLQILGGSMESQYYKYFRDLCVKAYLALRNYSSEIVLMAQLMMESGLPCFKYADYSIRKLRNRFRTDLDEVAAGKFMFDLVYKATENLRTVLYDSFQKKTNGIPY